MLNLNRGRKKYLTVKQRNQMEKVVYSNRSQVNRVIDLNNYCCPICGNIMRWKEANYSDRKDVYLLICGKCDVLGKARKERNGTIVLKSVPADKKTRDLREEAHYYFDILYKEKIFNSREQAYLWLAEQIYSYDVGIRHIGEMNAEQCKRAIEVVKDCLAVNEHRLSHPVKPYKKDYSWKKNR